MRRILWALATALLAVAARAAPTSPEPIDRAGWITPDDYPAEALALRIQGVVAFLLDVDVEGAVSSCSVTRSSGYAVLDMATCRLLRARAHYRVMRDEHSQPIPFQVRSVTTWRLPTADEGRDRPVRFTEGQGGTTCVADYDGRDRPLSGPTCEQIVAAVRARGDALDRPVTVWLPDALGEPARKATEPRT